MENRRRECISSACAFLCGTNKLKSEQHVLEKLQEKLINNLKSFTIQERNELLDYARLLESNINKDIAVIQDELFDVFDLLKKVTKEINDPEKLKQHDISYFRTKISELEKRIFTLHSNCTRELKKLNEEEIALTIELEAVEDVIESWATGTVRNTIKRVQSSSKIKCNCDGDNDNLTPEVKNFQNFLEQSGGHTGGWSQADHLFFLNLRKKHNAEATATLFNQKCPDKSIERVLAHDAWHETYTQLKREQEKSIKEWRMNHKTKHVRTCYNYDGPKLDTKSSRNIDRDPELKTKLKIWKEHQKIKKEEEEEEKKQTELLKKKEEEVKRQQQERRRAFVNEYKLQKLSCEQAMEIARQVEEEKLRQQNAARANSLIRTFREDDKKYALRMRERFQQQHDKKQYRKSSSSSESSVKVSRDPERLMKPTEVWRLKTAKKDDIVNEAPQPVLYVRDIPRLGIPKWREEVSNTF